MMREKREKFMLKCKVNLEPQKGLEKAGKVAEWDDHDEMTERNKKKNERLKVLREWKEKSCQRNMITLALFFLSALQTFSFHLSL